TWSSARMWFRNSCSRTARRKSCCPRCAMCSRNLHCGGDRSRPSQKSTRSCRPATSRRAYGRPISCWRRCENPGDQFSAESKAPDATDRIRLPKRRIKSFELLALVDVDVVATRDASIELARTTDLLVRVFDHFAPLADPADGASDRKQHGEHRGREAHRLQRNARIEVDVRIELAVDEIFVAQRDLFQLHRDLH